jgi:hypothetical protein
MSIGGTASQTISVSSNTLGTHYALVGDSSGSGGGAILAFGGGALITWQSTNRQDSGSVDLTLRKGASNTLTLGASDASSPAAQKISTQGSRGGTDSNVAGANLTITSGLGTGNATPSSLILRSPLIGSSGTTAQTETTGLTIKNGAAVLSSYTVSGLPSASVSGAGALAMVSDANEAAGTSIGSTPTGSGSVKRVVYSDGTNWLLL